MSFLDFLRSRVMVRQIILYAKTARTLWIISERLHRRAGERLDALERLNSAR